MKKIIAVLIALMTVISLSGCMGTGTVVKMKTVTDPTDAETIKYTDYEDSLDGLCGYFSALGYAYGLAEATSDESEDPVVMAADMIGADKGYKFSYNYGEGTTVLELYSFSDTTGKPYQQAKTTGKLTVSEDMDGGTVDVTISSNGRYLMIYSDTKGNAERKAAIEEAFKGFYA